MPLYGIESGHVHAATCNNISLCRCVLSRVVLFRLTATFRNVVLHNTMPLHAALFCAEKYSRAALHNLI
jgi:hypothetical protein